MYSVDPAVTHLQQVTQYDCWHASLRMMTKWKSGSLISEPEGTLIDWLYRKCREGQNGYNAMKARALQDIDEPTDIDRHQAHRTATRAVSQWAAQQYLVSNRKQFDPFSDRPGLTLSLLPTILAEAGLRAVRGIAIKEELDDSSEAIEQMLKDHGPLYCLVNFGHVVVVIGINGDSLNVNDPLLDAPSECDRRMISISPCVARLA